MQTLKPLCEACGTANAIDSDYCQECGIRFIREKTEDDVWYDPTSNVLNIQTDVDKAICKHTAIVSTHQCECARCINCDEEIEKCELHNTTEQVETIMKAMGDYSLQTKKRNSLDHLRNEPTKYFVKEELRPWQKETSLDHLKETLSPQTPFPKDKRLDFEANQIPDWEFPKEVEKTFKEEFQKWIKDPHYIPIINSKKPPEKIEPIRDHIITKQKSSITRRDVQKGINPKKPKIEFVKDDEIKPHNFSENLLWLIPISLWSLFIYLSLYL